MENILNCFKNLCVSYQLNCNWCTLYWSINWFKSYFHFS